MARTPKAEIELTTHRIEAFSDGVFAIAITLLILEIKVPRLHASGGTGSTQSLASALLDLWPSYFGYIFSFVMIGIHWISHHYIFKLYERSDHIFTLLNGLYLFCISFLPFPTAVLAAYIGDIHHRQTAIVFYAFGLFMPAVAWLLTWLYASHNHHLLHRNLDERFIAHLTRRYILTITLYFIAFLVSIWHGLAGLTLCVGLTLVYLLPSRKPVFRQGTLEETS